MIKVEIIGGLGNQMFQYAAAKSLAIKFGTQVSANVSAFNSYDVHPLCLDKWQCNCEFDHTPSLNQKLLKFKFTKSFAMRFDGLFNIYVEKGIPFDIDFFKSKRDVTLFGYFQSEKYFLNIRDILLKEFSLKEPLSRQEALLENDITLSDSVAIHIRRGDYISNVSANSIHGVCNIDYFTSAILHLKNMNLLSNRSKLFIFSDDIEWCQANLNFEYETVYVHGNLIKPQNDMHLISKCKHQIISNSTFSWWGAWLNTNPNKCVIAPKKWFKTKHDSVDIIPQQWLRI